ncbi:hypothetical protein Tco_1252832 [Tanacetum coccineum]
MSDSKDSTVTYTVVSSPNEGAPPSPYYVSGPEYPPSPDFVLELVYPDFMPPEDEVLPAEEQPCLLLPHPLVIHQAMFLNESSDDDKDDDVDIKEDEEEEEHLAPADSLLPTLHLLLYQLLIMPHLLRNEPPTPFWSDTEVSRLLAIPSPPPSPLSPWSSPVPQIPSPPLLVSPLPLPVSPTYPLGSRAAMIWMRAEAPSISY